MQYEPGNYFGQLKKWGLCEEQGKAPFVWLDFAISHFGRGGEWEVCADGVRTVFLYVSDAAWPYTEEKLTRLGFNGNFGAGMDFSDAAKSDGVQLICKHELYQNKPREKWDLFREGGGMEHTEATPDTVRRLNAKWKLHTSPKPGDKPRPPVPALRTGPIEDDEIPI